MLEKGAPLPAIAFFQVFGAEVRTVVETELGHRAAGSTDLDAVHHFSGAIPEQKVGLRCLIGNLVVVGSHLNRVRDLAPFWDTDGLGLLLLLLLENSLAHHELRLQRSIGDVLDGNFWVFQDPGLDLLFLDLGFGVGCARKDWQAKNPQTDGRKSDSFHHECEPLFLC